VVTGSLDVQFDGLFSEAVEASKKSIIDTLGVMVGASSTTPALGGVDDFVREAGGTRSQTVTATLAQAKQRMRKMVFW